MLDHNNITLYTTDESDELVVIMKFQHQESWFGYCLFHSIFVSYVSNIVANVCKGMHQLCLMFKA